MSLRFSNSCSAGSFFRNKTSSIYHSYKPSSTQCSIWPLATRGGISSIGFTFPIFGWPDFLVELEISLKINTLTFISPSVVCGPVFYFQACVITKMWNSNSYYYTPYHTALPCHRKTGYTEHPLETLTLIHSKTIRKSNQAWVSL